jgi:hypothetical protein
MMLAIIFVMVALMTIAGVGYGFLHKDAAVGCTSVVLGFCALIVIAGCNAEIK